MCLTAGTYYAVVILLDTVGHKAVHNEMIILTGDGSTEDCDIEV